MTEEIEGLRDISAFPDTSVARNAATLMLHCESLDGWNTNLSFGKTKPGIAHAMPGSC
jgi:hypothetical protein